MYSFQFAVGEKFWLIFSALAFLHNDNEVVKKIFDELALKYATRNGGYTRILKLDERRGDNALLAIIELV